MSNCCINIDKDGCVDFYDDRKIITVKDKGNKQTYIGKNDSSKNFCKIRIDDCLIKDGTKCDFLLISKDIKKAFFIELKGSDLLHALKQIESTINYFKNKLNNYSLNARIVLNKQRTPDLKSTQLIKFEKMLKKYNGDLKKQSPKLEEVIS